ncbi:sodium-dependent transporter [Clostridium sp.]|uniref:sodium-dependent transporter n=1 Tax=Clostridium sp. TaxID=1506 RepID=UPI003216DB97
MEKREKFTGKLGFILSCVGAAVGLGNIWMFPYKLGENGGAAFLIPYFIFVLLLGTVGLISEFAFGRQFRVGSMGAIQKIFKEKNIKYSSIISTIPTLGLTGIFMFYTVVIGWVLKYFIISFTGEILTINTKTYFSTFTNSNSAVLWHGLAVLITLIIVSFGVSKGIEKINKIIIPLLFITFALLIVKSLSLPGSMEGVKYLLAPDWSYLLKPNTWVMALGQAFFTVSLTGCCMVMCGSYTDEKFDIPNCAINTVLFDTLAAMLAAFMIMPAVFALGLSPTAGPALLFVTVPSIFQTMQLGQVLSTLFFLSIIFASISSSIAMLEGPVEAVMNLTKWNRKKTTYITAILTFILAIPLSLSGSLFDKFTNFITIVLSPIGALITAIVFFYILDSKETLDQLNLGANRKFGMWFMNFGKYVFVPTTVVVIILGLIYGGIG